ncbi:MULTISPECIES: hypothetical protein [Mesorhizobium]|uniref:IS256 family transposase n=1 Tax=Mesorhizobium escarrei TaxID=666018 RepID=A0ABM9EHR1_9HYPH|nr:MULTISPECIES: hypothetical protein [Mesorhizobium]TIL58006.1 MAG: hypothetical protein E5Y79_21390 [Mesorhizobium sp.]CAH2408911.1 conserved hypothetical protein [Mesorhizobium escarrei]
MSDTRALVAESLSTIEIGRPGDDKLVDVLTQIIDEEVALIVRENLDDRKPATPAKREPPSRPSAGAAQRAGSKPGGRKSGS